MKPFIQLGYVLNKWSGSFLALNINSNSFMVYGPDEICMHKYLTEFESTILKVGFTQILPCIIKVMFNSEKILKIETLFFISI